MKKLVTLVTYIDRESIMSTLQENTFPTENDFQTLIFGKYYFSGQVNSKNIRIRNASRNPRSPSPIFSVTIDEKGPLTEITVYDDSEDDIKTYSMITLSLTRSFSVVTLLVGGILSAVHDSYHWIPWLILAAIAFAGIGFLNAYLYKTRVKSNTTDDLTFLATLMKSRNV